MKKKERNNKTKVAVSASLSRKKLAPNFENLYDHLNTIDSNNESSSENSESKQNFQRIHENMHA